MVSLLILEAAAAAAAAAITIFSTFADLVFAHAARVGTRTTTANIYSDQTVNTSSIIRYLLIKYISETMCCVMGLGSLLWHMHRNIMKSIHFMIKVNMNLMKPNKLKSPYLIVRRRWLDINKLHAEKFAIRLNFMA